MSERAEILAATRDLLRRLARLSRLCRCCGTHVPADQVIYAVTAEDDPNGNYWRMCGSCWRSGYERGETVDQERAA